MKKICLIPIFVICTIFLFKISVVNDYEKEMDERMQEIGEKYGPLFIMMDQNPAAVTAIMSTGIPSEKLDSFRIERELVRSQLRIKRSKSCSKLIFDFLVDWCDYEEFKFEQI